MHSEGDIKKAIRPLLDQYGELNTTQIKDLLEKFMVFDEEDLIPSDSRKNENRITQRIGNIVSHQSQDRHYYKEGFYVDKRKTPAIFTLAKGLSSKHEPLPKKEIQSMKKKAIKRYRPGQIIDWKTKYEQNSKIGRAGEKFVLKHETEEVKKFDPISVDRVIHCSATIGDGLGYDISSIDSDGNTIFIEVKTTAGDADERFYISRNELLFFKDHENSAFLYRVYNFDITSKTGSIKIITAKELLDEYQFNCISFEVKKKTANN